MGFNPRQARGAKEAWLVRQGGAPEGNAPQATWEDFPLLSFVAWKADFPPLREEGLPRGWKEVATNSAIALFAGRIHGVLIGRYDSVKTLSVDPRTGGDVRYTVLLCTRHNNAIGP